MVQRHITSGECEHVSPTQYIDLKQAVAQKFDVQHTDVLIVGSAKLGFSISPQKRWKSFGEQSDVDVAIISTALYVRLWRQIAKIINVDPTFNWEGRRAFQKYHLKGWLRPDALPVSPGLGFTQEWFEYFAQLTSAEVCGPVHISAGIYYDLGFLEQYQMRAVRLCREELSQ